MRGQASTRGFPNCAMSLSVIDRFASAINTGHQALTTLYSSLSPTVYPRPTTHVHILSLSLSYNILHRVYRSYPRAYVYMFVCMCVCVCVSVSLSLSRYFPSSLFLPPPLSLALSQRGVETLTFKRASEGEHGALSTLSRYSPSHLVSPAFPSSPLAAHYRPVFSTVAFKL